MKNTNITTTKPREINQNFKRLKIVSLVIFWSMLVSCSSTPPYEESDFSFSTLITDTSIKRFEYAMSLKEQVKLYHKNQAQLYSKQYQHNSTKYMVREISRIIKDSQFCRNGYILLGRYAGKTTHRIRGECKESASPDEISRFPNTIQRW